MCKCIEGRECFQCAVLPENGALLNICELFTDPATGICTFDSTTTAGLVLAVSLLTCCHHLHAQCACGQSSDLLPPPACAINISKAMRLVSLTRWYLAAGGM